MSTDTTAEEIDPADLTHLVDEEHSDGVNFTALCGYTWVQVADPVRSPFCAECLSVAYPTPPEPEADPVD